MEGKKVVDAATKKAALEQVDAGGSVNQGLIEELKSYMDECFKTATETGE
jgi:hypothetical protein